MDLPDASDPDLEGEDVPEPQSSSIRTLVVAHALWLVSRLLLAIGLVLVGFWLREPLDKIVARLVASDSQSVQRDRDVAEVEEIALLVSQAKMTAQYILDALASLRFAKDAVAWRQGANAGRQIRFARTRLEELRAKLLGRQYPFSPEVQETLIRLLMDCDEAMEGLESDQWTREAMERGRWEWLRASEDLLRQGVDSLQEHERIARARLRKSAKRD